KDPFMTSRARITPRPARLAVATAAVSALLLTSCGADASDSPDDAQSSGGTLHYALGADPPTLDIQQTTAGVVSTVAYNVVEFLYVRDSDGENVPMLAKSAELGDDGLT